MPDEMRLAIRMSQPLMQRLPPPMKQREMQTSSEHTTACAGDTYVALDTISVSAAITSENRRMEHLPLRKDRPASTYHGMRREASWFTGSTSRFVAKDRL
jgi:hypothetical protein